MRKMTVEMDVTKLSPLLKKFQGNMLEILEGFEVLELLRTDFEKGIKVHVSKFTIYEGKRFEDIKWPKNFNVQVLSQEGREYIVLISSKAPNKAFLIFFKRFQLDIIMSHPTKYENGKMIFSFLGEADQLKKAVKRMKLVGKITNVSYHRAVYQDHNLLCVLTEKQKNVMITAKRLGYYDYPRKIDAGGLAKKVGLSKTTVLEHLRKAEGRLVKNLLAGY